MYFLLFIYLFIYCNVMTSVLASATKIKLKNSKGGNEKSMREENSLWCLRTACWVRFVLNAVKICVCVCAYKHIPSAFIEFHTMMRHGGPEVNLAPCTRWIYIGKWSIAPLILNLGTKWYEKSASHPSRSDPGKRAVGAHWIWGYVGPRVSPKSWMCDKSLAHVANRLVI